MRLFSDDAFIYRIINDTEDRQIFQEDLDKFIQWEQAWKINLIRNGYDKNGSLHCYKQEENNKTSIFLVLCYLKRCFQRKLPWCNSKHYIIANEAY